MTYDIEKIRGQFPILQREINGKSLVYFDNAATTQKPLSVIERVSAYYRNENCNIHRGVHFLSQEATQEFEDAREKVRGFINAGRKEEIIFTKGTTEAINLVAYSFGRNILGQGDEVLITALEHHSNLVPWQVLCREKNAFLRVVPINNKGEVVQEAYKKMLGPRTKMVAIGHISNALGTINPVREMIAAAHEKNIPVLVDGAQAASHIKIDVQELDCDFYCFSGHKAYGPMGSGVLFGKTRLLESMDPYQCGGEMVDRVTFEKTTYNELPFKFEAGTPNVESILGLKTALDFMDSLGMDSIGSHEKALLEYGTEQLARDPDITIYGTADRKTSIISFLFKNIHPYDAGIIFDKTGIALRTGNHCAQPVMDRLGISGTIRVSFGAYNTIQEIDRLVESIGMVKKMLG
ncbi:MAG: cysteine desulfurase [Bacteroidales bacterium]